MGPVTVVGLSFLVLAVTTGCVCGVVQCTAGEGGGVCPDGNTCCPIHVDPSLSSSSPFLGTASWSSSVTSGCIPNDMGDALGSCCEDGITGCAPGYICINEQRGGEEQGRKYCLRSTELLPPDPLVTTMPRYTLCTTPAGTLQHVHGLPILKTQGNVGAAAVVNTGNKVSSSSSSSEPPPPPPQLAYYSTHGDLLHPATATNSHKLSQVRVVLIIVHGMNRNADDYFCSGNAMSSLQTYYPNHNMEHVLVIAPRFLNTQDKPVTLTNGLQPMIWDGTSHNQDDVSGTWRYGASPVFPPNARHISSYDAMDALVQFLANGSSSSSRGSAGGEGNDDDNNKIFPNLERITVAGHSSGGQFVQRWSLLSGSNVWKYLVNRTRTTMTRTTTTSMTTSRSSKSETNTIVVLDGKGHHLRGDTAGATSRHEQNRQQQQQQLFQQQPHEHLLLRAVVANPSSYAYLNEKRYMNGKWRIPTNTTTSCCPNYNQWEWGLQPGGGALDVPYFESALSNVNGNTTQLARRFAQRDVIYLSGGVDRCNVTGDTKGEWCYSHGLETGCVDEIQGQNRFERSLHYYESLREYFGGKRYVHKRFVVEGVGHDHSLMFESAVGLKALFGDYNDVDENVYHEGNDDDGERKDLSVDIAIE